MAQIDFRVLQTSETNQISKKAFLNESQQQVEISWIIIKGYQLQQKKQNNSKTFIKGREIDQSLQDEITYLRVISSLIMMQNLWFESFLLRQLIKSK
ncbi:hypothetical protein TTHERM_00609390 (macronuclear) [Tetrahymena thermophila SB210]|uniref:Uncharacterized protein n=1 Tax=Tetrahymena thermophila (strain SB210) TaxID=312017 RepID=Q22YF0_TETTS|nr:hypothetical protein TTHERM_00609390 [Tetrahymena thermophila SB210]EAR90335.2 hypothetical protein TTHERM_00609390 [Tetrahymena thermophila SB210]|eukprot:XP_001010580.2 hypothetical protein TTHERM_00609390 [Tetrahymena thermophila SB210]